MEGANFNFNTLDFSSLSAFGDESFMKPVEGSTSNGYFFGGDEGIDTNTTGSHFDLGSQTLFPETGFTMQQNLAMDNTLGGPSAWHSTMSLSPAPRLDDFSNTNTTSTSFDSMSIYQSQQPLGNVHHKRSLPLDVQDFPQTKRHESAEFATFSPFMASASVTGSSSWTMDTPASANEIGLTDEAADVCATWFSKYAVLPSDRHIESLSQLTGESHNAIRQWFGQMLKQGMAGHDSAYKSQTSLSQQDQFLVSDASFQTAATDMTVASDVSCNHDTQTATSPPAARGGKKGCTPTSRPELLSRDPNKIYQCTRKCGKRYGRKCDWKRNEEEGYPSKSWTCILCVQQGLEKVKPCFRKYHFSQHFRNIHPGLNSADYEAESVVVSATSFPRKCGFCTHRFSSRQERIDHIADHFKKGKCMLDWNDDEDENADSDNMDDDDDDKPDSDSFDGSSNEQPDKDPQGRPGPKQNGNSGNGRGGQQTFSGFGQFQLSQLKNSDANAEELWSGVEQQSISWNKPNNSGDNVQDGAEPGHQCSSREQRSQQQFSSQEQRFFSEQCSSQEQRSSTQYYPSCIKTEGDDTDLLARNAIAGTMIDPNNQSQTPMVAPKVMTALTTNPPLQKCKGDGVLMEQDQINPESAAADSQLWTASIASAQQDGGPVSTPSSCVLPVTESVLSEEIPQSHETFDVRSSPMAGSSTEEIPRDKLRLLTLEGGGIRDSTLIILMEHLMGQLKDEDETGRRARLRDFFDVIGGTSTGGLIATMLGRVGVAPPAIFDLVGEMCLASKEQLISDNGRQDLTSQLPPPPPRPSILDGYADRSLRATLVGKGDGLGMNPTSESRSAFQHRETQAQTRDSTRRDNRSNACSSEDLFMDYQHCDTDSHDSKLDLSTSYEGTAGDQDATENLIGVSTGISVEFGLSRTLSRRPSLQEIQPLAGRSITLEIESNDTIGNVKSKIQHDEDFSSDQHLVVFADQPLEDEHTFRKLMNQPSNFSVTTTQAKLAEEDLGDCNQRNVLCDSTRIETPAYESQIHIKQPLDTDLCSTAKNWLSANALAINCNQSIPAFLSVKLLGTGGFSTVDEVVHLETNLHVSRKTLKNRDLSAIQELRKEVSVLQKLRHPHIIRFLGAYAKGDKMSILLSPVAETTLAVWLENPLTGRSPGIAHTVVKMFGCLVSSIRYLHEQRPVVKHMDIKPQNILVMHGNQEFPHIILTDFGVSSSEAYVYPERRTKPLTRQYCAPEVPSGLAREQAADIWSLGCVLVEMATTAFSATNSQYLDFRKEFNGSEGKCYWQNIPRLHRWLSGFQEQASTPTEATVVLAVASMLSSEPTERPDAATLTMVFTPAPCCLGWANENASFPGPQEEFETVEMLVREDSIDCRTQLHDSDASYDQKIEPFTRAKNWLHECSFEHEACRRPISEASFLPTRLVDLQPMGTESSLESVIRIVDSVDIEPTTYAVISYVWGSSDLTLSSSRMHEMQSALTRDMLSTALNDAMTAAKNIGYRYIWVESLCIVQDSQSDKLHECPAMANVYRNAALTIVAHAKLATSPVISGNAISPKDCDNIGTSMTWNSKAEGASNHGAPPPSITLSTITSRSTTTGTPTHLDALRNQDFATDTSSWSLQERLLSRRLLHLTGEQIYWECNALKASETFPQGLPSLLWEKVHTKPTSISSIFESRLGDTVTSSSSLLPAVTPRTRTVGPRLLRNCQYIRRQGGAIGDSMSAQKGLMVHPCGRGRDSIMRSGQFETGRKRYNESKIPLQGKEDIGNMFGDGDHGFKFDFDFEVPKGTSVDWSGDGKIYVEEKGLR